MTSNTTPTSTVVNQDRPGGCRTTHPPVHDPHLRFRLGPAGARADDLALLAAGHETGWWDEHGQPPKGLTKVRVGGSCNNRH